MTGGRGLPAPTRGRGGDLRGVGPLLAGRSFETVVAGQAWHWVDPLAGATKAARLLHAGGRLAVFWNVSQPSPDLAEAFAAVYRRVLPDSPVFSVAMPGLQTYSKLFERAEGKMRDCGGFTEAERWQFDWERPYTRPSGWIRCRPSAAAASSRLASSTNSSRAWEPRSTPPAGASP